MPRTFAILLVAAITTIVAVTIAAATQKGITQIDHDRRDFLQLESDLWRHVNTAESPTARLVEVFARLRNFTAAHMHNDLLSGDGNEFIVLAGLYEWKLIEQDLRALNNLFKVYEMTLVQYEGVQSEFDELALNDLAETVLQVDGPFKLAATMETIENVMVRQNLYYKAMLEAQHQVCSTRQSAQQVLYQLYATISLTELRGYSMMQFSWMLLKSYGKGNYTKESELMRKAFEERAAKTQTLLRKVMERADLQVWRCDPQQHIEGTTFVAVTRLLQGFIENEVDMNSERTCKENCGHYQLTKSAGCYKDMFCSKQPKCGGNILNCQFIDSDMWVCPAKSSGTRRYEYVEYENGRVLGQKASCTRGTTKVDSWWRWVFWHCSYCLCMCDEEGVKSDRYFSLREAVSNVTANRVVTGLRFRKINRIIHLQIQEGQLLARGAINSTGLQWRPVAEFHLTDRAIKRDEDYHALSWNSRAIDTDDLRAPAHHVLTGVRMRKVGTHLNLEIRVTEADFETGALQEPSSWHSNDNTETSEQRRTQVTLTRPDIPTRTRSKSVHTTKSNQYMEFGPTDIDADVGQTTVPYLDAQDVVSIPPVALAGAGLYHKGQTGFGGFIAPKLITYDFAPHIEIADESSTVAPN